LTGYHLAQSSKVTPERISAYLQKVDLNRLSSRERARAIHELADMMVKLSTQDRRRTRHTADWDKWFEQMTEQEKTGFIEATLPSGFKQMLNAFEQLPPEKRRAAIDRTLKELAKAREAVEAQEPGASSWPGRSNRMEQLSPDLQQKVVNIGLKSFYNESSAQTRAELAPVLEEMQRLMESGALFRGGRRP
jgi:hypothetical protein